MSVDITASLPPDFAAKITALATSTGCSAEDTLRSILHESQAASDALTKLWSDEAVIAAADMQWPAPLQERQSELLYEQQARALNPAERDELSNLLEIYKSGQLQKARGMIEAHKRGLRQYPKP